MSFSENHCLIVHYSHSTTAAGSDDLLDSGLSLPTSCCGIPEAPSAPPPDCDVTCCFQPQASEIPEIPEGGRRLSAARGSNHSSSHTGFTSARQPNKLQ
ncbi:hypothetical protein Q5P01_021856 [Channa striata]|uniref:Uncharacterized protein n=1 Tax=Channa striata TaxID=64152 RepID=A0AA88LUZ8_CHASR|nr:hypothetical protein Q5P01_021856 [Channa striata]